MFDCYLNESVLKRAQESRKVRITIHDLRDYAIDKHRTVDDAPYGGGAGMVIKVGPVFRAVRAIRARMRNTKKCRVVVLSAKGKLFQQKTARRLAKLDQLILICGRYEGIDERVAKYVADEEISIGEYVLTGGELPAMVIADAVIRLIPGVLGNAESLEEESFASSGAADYCREYPQYTRPEIFSPDSGKKWRVPKVLLSGNHSKITQWRKRHVR